jgi:catechol 2,3-dioxygenase-like lactoylglutathione lyase family enzyme
MCARRRLQARQTDPEKPIMKRFHVHVNVKDLDASIRFYSNLFAAEPAVVKPDYAKWMLDDPRVNFAISRRERSAGVDHLGLQAETADELAAIGERVAAAGAIALAETGTTCCYARSDKVWAEDPQGLRWETFLTHGAATTYFEAAGETGSTAPAHAEDADAASTAAGACCNPAARSATGRCG